MLSREKMRLQFVLLTFLCGISCQNFGSNKTNNNSCADDVDVLQALLGYKSTYSRHRIPGHPVYVEVELWIQEVTSLSELSQDFEIDLYVNEFWKDENIRYDHMQPCKANLTFDHFILSKLWVPNTCFINSKDAQLHQSPFTNVFLMLFPNGTLWVNYRVKLKGPCDMDLSRFPMDTQTCHLTFESYNYNTGYVRMKWRQPAPIQVFKKIELPDFTMVNHTIDIIQRLYAAGYWDELTAKFVFKRRYVWYILQGYIPTYLAIFISWISFYLGPRAIPARTMIGVNSLLAMTYQFGNIFSDMPRFSYVKAVDIWMLSGMMFIFASLLELAVVGHKSRNFDIEKKTNELPLRPCYQSFRATLQGEKNSSIENSPAKFLQQRHLNNRNRHRFRSRSYEFVTDQIVFEPVKKGKFWSELSTGRRDWKLGRLCCFKIPGSPEKIDKVSAIMFPTVFFMFNLIYWGYYLSRY